MKPLAFKMRLDEMCEVAKKKEMNWSRKVSILTAESHKMCFLYGCLQPELLAASESLLVLSRSPRY